MILKGKVALVTGGGQGIGKEFVKALLLKEAKVAVLEWNKETGSNTVRESAERFGDNSVLFVACDVSKQADLKRSFEKAKEHFGRLDIVVNNAAVIGETDWEKTLDIDLKGVFGGTVFGMQLIGRDKGGNGGVIVNISSFFGVIALPFTPAYHAAKHGVIGLTRSFGSEQHLTATGVRVNCICPWFVETAFSRLTDDRDVYFPSELAQSCTRVIGGHDLIQRETVAKALIAIIEDDSKNGEALMILQNSNMEYVQFQEFKPDSMP